MSIIQWIVLAASMLQDVSLCLNTLLEHFLGMSLRLKMLQRWMESKLSLYVDQCMLGLTSMSGIPMRKRTKLMTNCHVLASRFRTVGLCDRSHKHQVIQGAEGGVRRSVWSQQYPRLMCQLLAQPV